MLYSGRCHCGRIAFDIEGELSAAVACNCSICSRKGALLWAVPREKLRLHGPQEGIGSYTFNKHAIEHRFCRTCGIHPFAEDAGSQDGRMAYINIRCLENVDPASVETISFDGRSM
jgi:hypothetical protein